ncbi:histone acetyltransferase type B catalytic subunit [Macrosteles quadrilineatus]|uniref:histone acetyltransferase type B catalytic subunit n=1 Tax=Macrosteles quadrilineatus TaxID=74068 RepID=UPI0023E0EABD|nr:histone acetyltransferase type B catalytic subunit [Macrosteles quadrilineatus]
MDMDIAGSKEAEYVCDSNEALEFKLVRVEEDLEDDSISFKPEMSHQIFGDSESIFGYKELTVKLYYSACRLTMYLGLEYQTVVDPNLFGGVKPDNVMKIIQEKLQVPAVLTNIDEFSKALKDDDSFQPFGDKLASFSVKQGNGNKNYEIYHCDTNNKKFLNFHERLQTFVLFYIDAASYIDVDDSKWQFFVIYEKFKNPSGSLSYAVVGYSTVYEYYAYPDRVRPRVSQMLVLPPFQRQGLGAHLLCAIYSHYRGQAKVADITVEDPNEEFQSLRDYVDACLCSSLPSFSKDNLKQGFDKIMAEEACSKFKINKKQARRVYEILRLKETNVHNDDESKSFRLDVKRRYNILFQKEAKLMKKLKPLLDQDPQLHTNLGLKTPEQRFEILEKLFLDTEKDYQKTILRIEKHPLPSSIL